jgi:hypothetical protein
MIGKRTENKMATNKAKRRERRKKEKEKCRKRTK